MCFPLRENVSCVVFGSETIRESDSNMIKVVKGGINPWSVLWNLTFFTWLNNDAIASRAKGRVCCSSLLWPAPDLQIWKRLKGNGWHLRAHCSNSLWETQKFTESFTLVELSFQQNTSGAIIHFLEKAETCWLLGLLLFSHQTHQFIVWENWLGHYFLYSNNPNSNPTKAHKIWSWTLFEARKGGGARQIWNKGLFI